MSMKYLNKFIDIYICLVSLYLIIIVIHSYMKPSDDILHFAH
jgi:hypothetical protein